ncbi:hypothetical protein [Streptomyces jumonjinensis]|uniref:Uncharacterized protein n=1 Tax=Streptomyces jumonjinensis TaxID=1945 RepID=A0A646KM98_STRJU|nr:hypothetical protein [Streptomyces jumonjinensis]MQT03167.1 hypothetical protein [Streptomyces jumonjinensis]
MVEDETRAELARLGVEETAPGLTALAVKLAEAIDGADAPTAIAVAARELRATMQELRRLAPVDAEGDTVDDIAAARARRRAAAREAPG